MATEVLVIICVAVGLVVACVMFGLMYLYSVLPELKAKKDAKNAENAAAPNNEEQINDEQTEEEAVLENPEEEVLEETAAENAVLAEEEPEEEQVDEDPAPASVEEEPEEEPVVEPAEEEVPVEEVPVEEPEPAPEPEPEPVKEEPVKEEEPDDEPEDEEDDVEDNESETEKEVRLAAIEDAPELEQGQKYNRSYKARLIQSSDAIKGWYSQIKNAALSYKGVKSTVSWRQEKVTKGRVQVIKLALRGKTLSVYFPLWVSEVKNYDVEDVSDKAVHAATPCLLRVKKEVHVNQALELIAQSAAKLSLEATAAKKTDYVKEYKLETTEQLIEEGLIKVVGVKK
ncbi:MAG: hypothetical protein K2L67_04765 [Clostridia bacterium]|nr:hypothetical protein [Clostridia bacterium]